MENLKKIPGYSFYSTTKDGQVWSDRLRKGWMKHGLDRSGYHRISLIDDNGRRKGVYVHQIVAMTYLANPDNKPFVNHRDHDKSNNILSNLSWCTHLENIQHDWAKGTRKAPPSGPNAWSRKYLLSTVRKLRKMYDTGQYSQTGLSRLFNIPQPTVHVIVKRKQWSNI